MRKTGIEWLRARAEELRAAAASLEDAYREPDNVAVMRHVAKAYRRAAVVLDESADTMDW